MTDELQPGLVVRPDYLAAVDDTRDSIGRKHPRPFNFHRLMSRWTKRDWVQVPAEYWTVDLNADGYSVAQVSCPCGHTPSPEVLGPGVNCDGPECSRVYYFGGDRVLVAYLDGERPTP